MNYLHRKPKDLNELSTILEQTNCKGKIVDFLKTMPKMSGIWFENIKPMVLIYTPKRFIGFAYYFNNDLFILDSNES